MMKIQQFFRHNSGIDWQDGGQVVRLGFTDQSDDRRVLAPSGMHARKWRDERRGRLIPMATGRTSATGLRGCWYGRGVSTAAEKLTGFQRNYRDSFLRKFRGRREQTTGTELKKLRAFFTSATSCPLLGSFRDSSTLGISIFVSDIKFRCIEILVEFVNFIWMKRKRNIFVIFVHRGNVLCLLVFLKNHIILNSLILVIRISYRFFYHIHNLGFLFNYLLFVGWDLDQVRYPL